MTDQTSAHDPLNGYVPAGHSLEAAADLRAKDRDGYVAAARASMARHCAAMVGFQQAGAEVFDYGNNLRGEARAGGFADAFAYPGFVPAYLRPLFCEGKGPFRWVALSGDPADIAATDRAVGALFPDDRPLQRWLRLAAERVAFQGLPARICWLGYGERHRAGLAFNDLVRSGEVQVPHRDRAGPPGLRVGGLPLPGDRGHGRRLRRHRRLAHPQRLAQHRLRRRLGGGAPRRRGGHGQVDPRRRPGGGRRHRRGAFRLERVLTNDPGTGVMRHADAGYPRAIEVARERGVRIPMLGP